MLSLYGICKLYAVVNELSQNNPGLKKSSTALLGHAALLAFQALPILIDLLFAQAGSRKIYVFLQIQVASDIAV